jgi:hypothetical protein
MSLSVSIHDESHRGGESLKAEAQFVKSGDLGDFCSVTIADGDPKNLNNDHIKVFSSSPENLRAIAEAFLDAAVLLESAKPKVEPAPAVVKPEGAVWPDAYGPCARCLGSGDIGGNGEELTCPDCQGSGTQPKASPLQGPPDKTITHADGVKVEELPL